MARMIPSFYDKDRTTSGERRTFDALKQLGDQYAVLHSLALPDHIRQAQGEADFVIIGPEGLLCLEVKGGRVTHRNGVWRFTDGLGRSYERTKSPWDQAMGNVMSIRHKLGRIGPPALQRCLYATGVVFPDIRFKTEAASDSSVIPEVLLDGRRRLAEIATFVSRCFDYWRARRANRDPSSVFLNSEDVTRARELLRGDFDFVPGLEMWVSDAAEEIDAATQDEKERYLAQVGEHDRILLTGAAGTGKTMVSREYARRRAAQGDRVLFLCFNRNLRDMLRHLGGDQRIRYASFHDYMEEELARLGRPLPPPPETAPPDERDRFYRAVLPEAFCDAALSHPAIARYDCLVVDEGQDLIAPIYLDCMDVILVGGLRDGRWHMCYDPNQNIYNPDGFGPGLRRLEEEARYWDFKLVVNCRNTYAIAAYNAEVTATEMPSIARIPGPPVETVPFADRAQERALLAGLLRTLIRGQGISRKEIFLLSPTGFRSSCLENNPLALGADLAVTDMTKLDPLLLDEDTIKFCTAQGFKGLEAPVVILLDVERLDRPRLLCTALSRAKSVLYVFYDARLKSQHELILRAYTQRLAEDLPRLPITRGVEDAARSTPAKHDADPDRARSAKQRAGVKATLPTRGVPAPAPLVSIAELLAARGKTQR